MLKREISKKKKKRNLCHPREKGAPLGGCRGESLQGFHNLRKLENPQLSASFLLAGTVRGCTSCPAHQDCREVPLPPAPQSSAALPPSLARPSPPGKLQPGDAVLVNSDGWSELSFRYLGRSLGSAHPLGNLGDVFHLLPLV